MADPVQAVEKVAEMASMDETKTLRVRGVELVKVKSLLLLRIDMKPALLHTGQM